MPKLVKVFNGFVPGEPLKLVMNRKVHNSFNDARQFLPPKKPDTEELGKYKCYWTNNDDNEIPFESLTEYESRNNEQKLSTISSSSTTSNVIKRYDSNVDSYLPMDNSHENQKEYSILVPPTQSTKNILSLVKNNQEIDGKILKSKETFKIYNTQDKNYPFTIEEPEIYNKAKDMPEQSNGNNSSAGPLIYLLSNSQSP